MLVIPRVVAAANIRPHVSLADFNQYGLGPCYPGRNMGGDIRPFTSRGSPTSQLDPKAFYRIDRPLLFRDFEFHPYLCLAGFTRCPPAGLVIPEAEYIPPLLQRLQFWSGPDIRPLVRTCRVTQWSREGARTVFRAWDPRRADSDPYILLSAFFDALPRFTALRLLVFADIRFTQLDLKQVGLLHNLDVLELNIYSVAHGEVANTRELTPLHVSQFTFQHEGHPDTCFDHWVPLLNPQIFTHLELSCNVSVLLGGNIFPCVKHLKITLSLSLP